MLKETLGHGDRAQHTFHLEKSLLEEQLYSSDLKKKLQSANKQIASLKSRVKSLELQRSEGGGGMSLLGVEGVDEESVLERSRSMNDLGSGEAGEEGEMELRQKGGSPPSQYHLPRLPVSKQKYVCCALKLEASFYYSTAWS